MFKFQNPFINFLIFVLVLFSTATLVSLMAFTYSSEVLFLEFNLMSLRSLKFNFVIMLDLVSALFLLAVSLITLAVLKFSESYMSGDKNFYRFHLLLLLFVMSMYLLILSPNLMSLLLGWDGLGLSSYLLVIYYDSSKAYNSGMITVLTNRLGDTLILLSIAYLTAYGNWNLMFYSVAKAPPIFSILLMIAACTKSAQIPFSAWLPAAMAAPTPVSALVHSSTLVTAGVYILIRHADMFSLSLVSSVLMILGTSTMLMASFSALLETDLKKMVALSTLSQLGVMMLGLGLGAYFASFFHLLSHAFFKALLFLTAGAVIHGSSDYQDLRLMGNSARALPIINSFTLISVLSLMGAPFMSAFFSKELILETILVFNINASTYYLMILGVGLTAMYSSRFLSYIFARFAHNSLLSFKLDEDLAVIVSMLVLVLPAVSGGFLLNYTLQASLKLSSAPWLLKLSIIFILVAAGYLMLFHSFLSLVNKWPLVKWVLSSMWLLPLFSAALPVGVSAFSSISIPKIFDRGALSLQTILLNSYFNFSSLKGLPYTHIYKIVGLATIWGFVILSHYLRNIYKTLCLMKSP